MYGGVPPVGVGSVSVKGCPAIIWFVPLAVDTVGWPACKGTVVVVVVVGGFVVVVVVLDGWVVVVVAG